MAMKELLESFLEVETLDRPAFLKIKETLTRIGVSSRRDKTLAQICFILHKRGQYFITHFKEMMALDGREVDLTEEDVSRRNTIALLLEEWKLLKLKRAVVPTEIKSSVKVLHFDEKKHWTLVPKYTIGKKFSTGN